MTTSGHARPTRTELAELLVAHVHAKTPEGVDRDALLLLARRADPTASLLDVYNAVDRARHQPGLTALEDGAIVTDPTISRRHAVELALIVLRFEVHQLLAAWCARGDAMTSIEIARVLGHDVEHVDRALRDLALDARASVLPDQRWRLAAPAQRSPSDIELTPRARVGSGRLDVAGSRASLRAPALAIVAKGGGLEP